MKNKQTIAVFLKPVSAVVLFMLGMILTHQAKAYDPCLDPPLKINEELCGTHFTVNKSDAQGGNATITWTITGGTISSVDVNQGTISPDRTQYTNGANGEYGFPGIYVSWNVNETYRKIEVKCKGVGALGICGTQNAFKELVNPFPWDPNNQIIPSQTMPDCNRIVDFTVRKGYSGNTVPATAYTYEWVLPSNAYAVPTSNGAIKSISFNTNTAPLLMPSTIGVIIRDGCGGVFTQNVTVNVAGYSNLGTSLSSWNGSWNTSSGSPISSAPNENGNYSAVQTSSKAYVFDEVLTWNLPSALVCNPDGSSTYTTKTFQKPASEGLFINQFPSNGLTDYNGSVRVKGTCGSSTVNYTIKAPIRVSAASFDGTNKYVLIPQYGALSTQGDFTIEARIVANAQQSATFPSIVSDRNGIYEGFLLFLVSGKPWLQLNATNYPCSSCPTVTDDKPHHLAVTKVGTNLNIYVDGVLYFTRAITGPGTVTNSGNIYIGKDYYNDADTRFKGEISEVRIWDSWRSAEEIQANYQKTIIAQNHLIGYWRLNEGSGQKVYNFAGDMYPAGTLGETAAVETTDAVWKKYSAAPVNRAQGASFEVPIPIGALVNGSIVNPAPVNNAVCNNYGNDIGSFSDDVFWSFTLAQTSLVKIDLCQSNNVDFVLRLYNSNRQQIGYNDDNGPFCQSNSPSLQINLAAGTYYFAVEGWQTTTGTIYPRIAVAAPTGTPNARTAELIEDPKATKNKEAQADQQNITAYPNPVSGGQLYFTETAHHFSLVNASGETILTGADTDHISVTGIAGGMYTLILDGNPQKIIIIQ